MKWLPGRRPSTVHHLDRYACACAYAWPLFVEKNLYFTLYSVLRMTAILSTYIRTNDIPIYVKWK